VATQTIEFNATTGLTITAKMFLVGSDTIAGSVSATEKTNHKSRYTAAFTDLAAGNYLLAGFVSSTGGFANEKYTITATTATFYPFSETSGTTASVIGESGTTIDRVTGTTIAAFVGETTAVSVSVTDTDGVAVDLSSYTLELIIEASDTADVEVIAAGSITVAVNVFTFDLPGTVTASEKLWYWALRDTADATVLCHGVIEVNYAAKSD